MRGHFFNFIDFVEADVTIGKRNSNVITTIRINYAVISNKQALFNLVCVSLIQASRLKKQALYSTHLKEDPDTNFAKAPQIKCKFASSCILFISTIILTNRK